MKNKMKKLVALMLVGVALCGSVMTTQAAETSTHETCSHEGILKKYGTRTTTTSHTYVKNSVTYVCQITITYDLYDVVCGKCGVWLSDHETKVSETHSQVH